MSSVTDEQSNPRSGDENRGSRKGSYASLGDLKEHTYVCGVPNQVDKFHETTKAIIEWAGKNYSNDNDSNNNNGDNRKHKIRDFDCNVTILKTSFRYIIIKKKKIIQFSVANDQDQF